MSVFVITCDDRDTEAIDERIVAALTGRPHQLWRIAKVNDGEQITVQVSRSGVQVAQQVPVPVSHTAEGDS